MRAPLKKKRLKKRVVFFLTPLAEVLLQRMADQVGLERSHVLEIIIRQEAERKGWGEEEAKGE